MEGGGELKCLGGKLLPFHYIEPWRHEWYPCRGELDWQVILSMTLLFFSVVGTVHVANLPQGGGGGQGIWR